jgi:hypothetical protein
VVNKYYSSSAAPAKKYFEAQFMELQNIFYCFKYSYNSTNFIFAEIAEELGNRNWG